MKHGGRSDRVVLPRAEAIEAALPEDPGVPDHLRSPAFRPAVRGWAKAEAIEERLFAHVEALGEEAFSPRLPGTKAAVDSWRSAASHAANMRSKLGLDPVSYARIAKDLGIGARASEDAIARLAAKGAEIVARRQAIDAAGSVEGEPG